MVVLVYISFILRGTIHLNPEGIELSLPLNPNAVIRIFQIKAPFQIMNILDGMHGLEYEVFSPIATMSIANSPLIVL